MKLMIADDDEVTLRLLEATLVKDGYQVTAVRDGAEAWLALQSGDGPQLAILDWVMPGLDGVEICRRVKEASTARLVYLILLTARARREDIVAGLEAGADDYLVKPFNPEELRARVHVGTRMVQLQQRLAEQASELREARTRLIEQERFDAAMSAMSDGILTTDHEWRIITSNRSACRLLGLPDGHADGIPLATTLQPFALSIPWEQVQSSSARELAFEIARAHTEPPLFLDARLTRLLDDGGELAGAVLVVRNATEERHARRVQSTFINTVSHKLRTPLTLLTGYLDLCKKLTPEQRLAQWESITHTFETELRQLQETVQRLLDLKELRASPPSLCNVPTAVEPVVNAVGSQVQHRFPDKAIEIDIEISSDAAHVRVNPDHLHFILGNVVENAAKFGDKSPVRIDIRVTRQTDQQLLFSVADNGPGIPHEYLDRVKEAFVQVEDRATGRVPGLGVGLFMALRMVEAYGGELSIQSGIGEGTSISFTLPAG